MNNISTFWYEDHNNFNIKGFYNIDIMVTYIATQSFQRLLGNLKDKIKNLKKWKIY